MSRVETDNTKLWDIFCRVIDNYGDIGVCWRLAVGLAAHGERVRLWVDDASALEWMAPNGAAGVEVKPWTQPIRIDKLLAGDILVETFGCEIAPEFIAHYAYFTRARCKKSLWINLEYLSAEGFAGRSHGLQSPVVTGPGAGMAKHFFYPGFSVATGGLLREPDLLARRAGFDRVAWLQERGIDFRGERLVSLFCYEPPAIAALLDQLAKTPQPTRLIVTAGRAAAAVCACLEQKNRLQPSWNKLGSLSFFMIPALTQYDYDHLLWACDLNFVRGEDSLVRALWANKPFVWQIYPQHDDAHHTKLEAFMHMLEAPPSLRAYHCAWNGVLPVDAAERAMPELKLSEWQQTITGARNRLLEQDDLVTQVIRFASKSL